MVQQILINLLIYSENSNLVQGLFKIPSNIDYLHA